MAVKRWLGTANPVAQINTVTVSGTWATGDKAQISIGGGTLEVTVGSTTTSGVASAIAAAVNASSRTSGLVADEVRNLAGQEIPEMKKLTATASGSVVSVTTKPEWNGHPFTISVADTAAAGALSLGTTQAATGPNFVSNAKNWEGGSLPSSNDVLLFDGGSVSVLYDLGYFVTNTIANALEVTKDYIGQIGLPPYDATYGYREYRKRYLELYNTGTNTNYIRFTSGSGGANHKDIRLYCGGAAAAWTDLTSFAKRGTVGTPSVYVKGGVFTDVKLLAGSFSLDAQEAIDLSGALAVNTSFRVGGLDTTCLALVGESVDLAQAEDVKIYEGTTKFFGNVVYSGGGSPTFDVFDGSVFLIPPDGVLTSRDIIVRGGVLYADHRSGSGRKVTLYGGAMDMREATENANYDKVVLYKDSALYDPYGLATTEINLVNCDLQDVTLQLVDNRKLTLSTAST